MGEHSLSKHKGHFPPEHLIENFRVCESGLESRVWRAYEERLSHIQGKVVYTVSSRYLGYRMRAKPLKSDRSLQAQKVC